MSYFHRKDRQVLRASMEDVADRKECEGEAFLTAVQQNGSSPLLFVGYKI
jgi:hypothetical protein